MDTKLTIPSLIARMNRLEHFKMLSLADLEVIVASGWVRRMMVGETIFREAEPCAGLFVLLSGEVYLHKLGPEGRDHIMAVLKPVTMFNEVPVLDGNVNPATAIAAHNSLLWHCGREQFQALIEQYPPVGLGMLPVLARRNRELVAKFEDLSFRTVRARTAKLLLELSEHGRGAIDRRALTVNTLAAQIGTAPESVSRTITFFRDQGFICSTRAEITVCKPEILAKLAQIEPCITQPHSL